MLKDLYWVWIISKFSFLWGPQESYLAIVGLETLREEKIIWSTRWCTVPLLASPKPPLDNFILLLWGILEYRDSQHTGAILADEKPVSFHCYLVAEISIFRLKRKHTERRVDCKLSNV
jgi:hypothetical protein